MKKTLIAICLIFLSAFGGCGYTQKATLPGGIRTVAIETFEDKIPPDNRYAYQPGLEINLRNALIDRFIFDGNLKVVDADKADAVLRGAIVAYSQEGMRFDNLQSVKEYRLFLTVNFELVDRRTDRVLIRENGFSGRTEYLTDQTSPAVSRLNVGNSAIVDLAKNIVDRIVEDW